MTLIFISFMFVVSFLICIITLRFIVIKHIMIIEEIVEDELDRKKKRRLKLWLK